MNAPQKDQYSDWRARLRGEEISLVDGQPSSGFYRATPGKKAPPVGAAIWRDQQGKLLCRLGDKMLDEQIVCERWMFWTPISHALYQQWQKTGEWPDADPTVMQQLRDAPKPGDNSGEIPETDILKDQIEAASAGAKPYEKIEDEDTYAKAQSLRSRLLELHREADNKRDALKRPHLDANKKIDDEWQPLVKGAKAVADKIRSAMEAYTDRKNAAAKAQQEALAAEQRRLEKEAAEAGKPAPEPAPAPAPAPVQTTVRGATGRAATVKTKRTVTEVTDIDALFGYMKAHPEMKDLLMKLAQRALDAGRNDVPGVKIEDKAKIT